MELRVRTDLLPRSAPDRDCSCGVRSGYRSPDPCCTVKVILSIPRRRHDCQRTSMPAACVDAPVVLCGNLHRSLKLAVCVLLLPVYDVARTAHYGKRCPERVPFSTQAVSLARRPCSPGSSATYRTERGQLPGRHFVASSLQNRRSSRQRGE